MKPVKGMTREERVAELKRLFTTPENKLRPSEGDNPSSFEFKTWVELHQRIDDLVGRSTMTHEFAFPDLLYQEILSGERGNPMGESLMRATQLTKGKKAIIITPSQDPDLPGTPLGFKIVGKLDFSKEKEP